MEDTRPLTRDERSVLLAALAIDIPGAQQLREDAASVVARSGCSCGCGTIELTTLPEDPHRSVGPTLPLTGDVHDENDEIVGGMVIFLDADYRLYSLEIYSYDTPLQIPAAERVHWRLQEPRPVPST